MRANYITREYFEFPAGIYVAVFQCNGEKMEAAGHSLQEARDTAKRILEAAA